MKWFNNPNSLEELKKQYKKLALKHHPDIGGSNAAMQEINAEYDKLFEMLKNVHQTAEGKTYTTETESTEMPNEFKDIINKLIHFKGIKIEICGSWIWVTGNTINYRTSCIYLHHLVEELKTNGEHRKNHIQCDKVLLSFGQAE